MGSWKGGAVRTGVCLALALPLAACGASSGGEALGNLLAFNSLGAPPAPASDKKVVRVDCPAVRVDDAGSSVRVYAGAEQSNANVRYQFDIARFARQCDVENGQLAIKVGVEGRALIGPAGTPGSFVAPVRIAIERESDDQVVAQQVYRATATVAPGTGVAMFDIVSEPLLVPFTRQQADQDYSVVVGFDRTASGAAVAKKTRRRHRG